MLTQTENLRNKSFQKNNARGHTGVSWHKGKQSWSAYIYLNSVMKHLGSYSDIRDAIEARKQAESTFGFHINHGLTV